MEETFRKLTDNTNSNIEAFQQALGKQQDVLQKKLTETQVIVDELKNLSSIKDSISKFEKATAEQNRKIDRLTESIRLLTEAKVEGSVHKYHEHYEHRIPIWKKVIIWISVAMGLLVVLSIVVANWNAIYSFFFDVLRF